MQFTSHSLRCGRLGTASTYFTLCTRVCNMHTYRAKNPSASTAACDVPIGPILEFCAIATTETAMGQRRLCVRIIAITRTFSRRTGQPAAPAISRSGFLRALHSIRSNEPWQCSLGTLRQPPFLSGKKTTSLFNKKTTERFPGPSSPCRTSIQPPAAARANISMGTEQLLAFRLTAHASRPLSLQLSRLTDKLSLMSC